MMKGIIHSIKNHMPISLSGKVSVVIILLWILMAIFSPFIANNKPILAKTSEAWSMPIFSDIEFNENNKYQVKINPLIAYKFNDLEVEKSLMPPFTSGKNGIHLLGTDMLGRDIAAGMIHGARVAFVIASSAIVLSFIFGIFVGLVIGFYGDQGIKKNLFQQLYIILLLIFLLYYLIFLFKDSFSIYSMLPIFIIGGSALFVDKILGKIPVKKFGLPLDLFVQRLFEIKDSIPGIFIILAFIAIVAQPSIFTIPLILAFLYWMTFARYARAEAIQIREEEYIQSAKASGMGDFRILIHHILPNALPTLLVAVAFMFSGAILLESTLSFLGIGLPVEEVSWGKILAEARKYPKSWWLAIFPGLAIFLVLYSFNTLGDILANYQRNQN